jgi:DNA-binding beta-propeller fold protein YncE
MFFGIRRILGSSGSRSACACALAAALALGQGTPADELPVLGGPRLTIGALDTPRGVLFGPAGEIFVVESGSGRVREFAPDGGKRSSFGARGGGAGELERPEGIARTADGRLWIADSGNHRVAVFDAAGVWVANHGGLGSSPGTFHTPIGIAASGDRIAVADSRNARVQILDLDGAPLAILQRTKQGVLRRPIGVAFDPAGRLFVTDADLHRVVVFELGAEASSLEWGDWGWFPGLFSEPWGIAIAANRVFVADRQNHRVQVFDESGQFLQKFGVHAILPREGNGNLHYPEFLAVREDGLLAALSEPLDDRVQVLGAASEDDLAQARLRDSAGQASPHYGFHLAVSAGLLAIDEPETHSILLHDLRLGEPVMVCRIGGFGDGMGFFQRPSGVVLDGAARRMWVCEAGHHRIHEIRLRGSPEAELANDPEMAVFVRMLDLDRLGRAPGGVGLEWPIEPAGLARGPDGTLYLLDARNERVHVFSADLEYRSSFGQHGSGRGELAGPTSVCWSSALEALLVADTDNRRIQAFAPDGTVRYVIGGESAASALDRPWGLAAGADGTILVTDWGAHRVLRFDRGGALVSEFGKAGLGRSELYKPRGIAVDERGSLWVLDHANHRGMVFDAAGAWLMAFGSRSYTRPAILEGKETPSAGKN